MSTDKELWLRRLLDGELDGEEERQALHVIADDPDLRAMLKFDLQLRQDLPTDAGVYGQAATPVEVPESFIEGVMQDIAHNEQQEELQGHREEAENRSWQPGGLITGVTDFLDRLGQPRNVVWKPAWSAGIAAILLLIVISVPLLTTQQSEPASEEEVPVRQIVEQTTDRVMMRFVYIDNEAESVSVAGDFSEWEPIELNRKMVNGDVAWTGIVPLTRGEHRYMFIKNQEQWTTDPLAHRHVDDGFGNKNAVINL